MRGSLAIRQLVWPVLAAIGAAATYTLASSPYDLDLLAWLAPPLLLVPASRLSGVRSALPGLVFGCAIAVGITSWAAHGVLAYFAVGRGMALALAGVVWLLYGGLPYALLTAAYASAARRVRTSARPALAAILWVAVEMLRSAPPLGLPWGLLSHTQWRRVTLIQIADVLGAYGVTFVVVFVGMSAALAVRAHDFPSSPGGARARLWRAAPAVVVLALVLAYGAASRAATTEGARETRIAVVQGDVPHAERWQRARSERALGSYLRLTSQIDATRRAPDLIVWPENAVDLYLDTQPMLLAALRGLATRSGASVLIGAPRLAAPGIARNSAYLIDDAGEVRATYDKRLLVPFAEGAVFPATAHASSEPVYTGGTGAEPLATGELSLGVLICFEVLFPDLVRATVRRGANVLLNLSNDAWMDAGDGAAPRQHFAMSVLRAVEMRRALVRVSAGGTSGFVTAHGDVHDVVPWGETGPSVGDVALHDALTPYARFGEAWVVLACLGLVAFGRPSRPEES